MSLKFCKFKFIQKTSPKKFCRYKIINNNPYSDKKDFNGNSVRYQILQYKENKKGKRKKGEGKETSKRDKRKQGRKQSRGAGTGASRIGSSRGRGVRINAWEGRDTKKRNQNIRRKNTG